MMRYQKLFAAFSLSTILLFGISFACAHIGQSKPEETSYPLSIAKRYAEQTQHWISVNQTEVISASGILSIRIDTDATDVKFENSNGNDFKFFLQGRYLPKKDGSENILQVKQHGDELVVSTDEGGRSQDFTFADEARHGLLQIAIPASILSLAVKTNQGKLTGARELSLQVLKLETRSGAIDLPAIVAEQIYFKTSSGEVGISGTYKELVGNSLSGEISLQSEKPDPKIEITSGSGDIELNFSQTPSVRIDFVTKSGSLKVDSSAGKEIMATQSLRDTLGSGSGVVRWTTESSHCSIFIEDRD